MTYSNLMLFGLGFAGILLHCLVKIKQLKDTNTFKIGTYFNSEWVTICISTLVVVIAILCKDEIPKLKVADGYLGLGFVALGYMGQSILVTFMGKAAEKIGIKKDEE